MIDGIDNFEQNLVKMGLGHETDEIEENENGGT
jgi:hypothetical protein